MGELCAKVDVLIEKSLGKEVIRQEKMKLATDYQGVDEESLMDGNFLEFPSMDEYLDFFNTDAAKFQGVFAQPMDFVATDMYNGFDLSGINDGYPN